MHIQLPTDGASAGRAFSAPSRPGRTERILVIAFMFTLLFGTPNTWFARIESSGTVALESNPLFVAVQLLAVCLIGLVVLGMPITFQRAMLAEPFIAAFLLVIAASTFWSASPVDTIRQVISFGILAVFGWYLASRFELEEILRMAATSVVVGLVLCVFWIYALPSYGVGTNGEFFGVFPQKNALGHAMMYTVVLLAAVSNQLRRPVFVPLMALAIFVLVGSQSTTALVVGTLGVLLMVVYNAFRARQTLHGAVVVSLTSTALVSLLITITNLGPITDMLGKDITLTGRTQLWAGMLPMIAERPFGGYGFRAFWGGWFSPAHELWLQNTWRPLAAHNGLFAIMLELGILGVIPLLAIYLRMINRGTKFVGLHDGPAGLFPLSLISVIVLHSVTEAGIVDSSLGWVLLVATATVVGDRVKAAEGETSEPDETDGDHGNDREALVSVGPPTSRRLDERQLTGRERVGVDR